MLSNIQKPFLLGALPRILFFPKSHPHTQILRINIPKAFVTLTNTGAIYPKNKKNDDFYSELRKASEAGQKALTHLLDMLKEQVVDVSKQYQKSLEKQMKIEQKNLGRESSDDLSKKLKATASDLKIDLNNLMNVINSVGAMLRSKASKYVADNEQSLKTIEKKFRELEQLLNEEAKKMKKIEEEMLEKQKKKPT